MAVQQEFNWTYLQREVWINEAEIPRGVANDGTGVSPAVMTAVLHTINKHLGSNPDAWPGQELLASVAKISRRTVIRAVQALGRLSLLIVEQEDLPSGHRRNRYRIVWTELQLLEPSRRAVWMECIATRKPVEPADAPHVTPRDAATEPCDVTSKPCDVTTKPRDVTSHEQPTNNPKNLPPPLSSDVTSPGGADPPTWGVVVSVLKDVGMADTRGAVTAAKGCELTPAGVLDIVERWERLRVRQPRVTVGYLYRFLHDPSRITELEDPVQSQPPPGGILSKQEETKLRLESLRARAIRTGRRNGRSEQHIEESLKRVLEREGFAPDAISV